MHNITLQKYNNQQHSIKSISDIYFNSFPIEEQRPWNSIKTLLQTDNRRYNMTIIIADNKMIGFITWWRFNDFCYVEHFAIDSSMRGNGMGSIALKLFIKERPTAVILEVELPQKGEMALRRIDFYRRNGFTPHYDFDYIQPSYGEDLPPVPLMLMTANTPANFSLNRACSILHKEVYGVSHLNS